MIPELRECLLCFVTVRAGVAAEADADAWLKDALARALEANERWEQLAADFREENARLRAENQRLREENARLRERDAQREAELERVNAALAVLQRLVFGRSSKRARPEVAARDEDGGDGGAAGDRAGGGKGRPRGPGARAGRRDYSHLPRVEVVWDFPGGGYCCPQCGVPFTRLGDHVIELLDWQVTVRVAAHCRRRYRRACQCPVPATVMAPGPPKAIGKGLLSNGFIAMLFTGRYVAGRSQNSLVTGLARHGAQISPATLTGVCAQAGALLVPLEEAVTARSRDSWHLHADETSWHVFAPREGDGPARWWLWVFLGPDTACFVMDPTRAGAVLARHAGIDEETGQLAEAGDRPRQAGDLQRLLLGVHLGGEEGRRAGEPVLLGPCAPVLRAGRGREPGPADVLGRRVGLERIKALYAAHEELMAAWAAAAQEAARLEEAYGAWDDALAVIDEARRKQMAAPGLQEPAKKALATLDREWDGLAAHRGYPMISLDNYPDAAVMPMSAGSGGPAAGQGGALAA